MVETTRTARAPVAGETVVAFEGDLDLRTTPTLRRLLDGVADGRGPVVLDLSRARIVDATPFAAIVATTKRLRARGRHLIVIVGPEARRPFELTGLDRFVTLREPRIG